MKNKIDVFHKYDSSPFAFIKKAESLYMAFCHLQNYKAILPSDLLRSISHGESEVKTIGFTILGYALENAIKSELARQAGDSLDENKNLLKLIRGHELKILHQRAFPDFNDEDVLTALEKLSKFTVWMGRYSVPLLGEHYELATMDTRSLDLISARYIEVRSYVLKLIRPEYYP